jgi:multidrug transporter EmrE-like cation transporter
MNLYILVLLISMFEAFAQSIIHYAHYYKKKFYIIYGIILYIIIAFLIYKAYNYKGIGMVNAIWSGFSIIFMIIIGTYLFNEKILLNEYIGIFFIIIGVLITNKNKNLFRFLNMYKNN